jgi:hypothetical protein
VTPERDGDTFVPLPSSCNLTRSDKIALSNILPESYISLKHVVKDYSEPSDFPDKVGFPWPLLYGGTQCLFIIANAF